MDLFALLRLRTRTLLIPWFALRVAVVLAPVLTPLWVLAQTEFQVEWSLEKVNPPLTEKVVHFPLLIKVGIEAKELFQIARPDGSDLIVHTAAGKPLPLEIESWDKAQNKGHLWVQVDTISPQQGAVWLALGVSPQAVISPKAVFASQDGWSGVYHMEGRGFESTEQAPAAQDSGTTAVVGAIGGARGFSNTNSYATTGAYMNLGAPASLNISGIITMEAWVRWNSKLNHRIIVCHGQGNANSTETVLRVGEFQDYRTGVWTGKAAQHAHANASAADSAKWIHLAGTYDGSKWSLFRNGVKVADTTVTGGAQASPGNWRIGAEWTGTAVSRYFHGDIDEVRISKVARTPEYFKLSFLSQSPDSNQVKVFLAPVALNRTLQPRKTDARTRKRSAFRLLSDDAQPKQIRILPDGRRLVRPSF
jgi:Concanavalin A-like lectin/glucanases superfamily